MSTQRSKDGEGACLEALLQSFIGCPACKAQAQGQQATASNWPKAIKYGAFSTHSTDEMGWTQVHLYVPYAPYVLPIGVVYLPRGAVCCRAAWKTTSSASW